MSQGRADGSNMIAQMCKDRVGKIWRDERMCDGRRCGGWSRTPIAVCAGCAGSAGFAPEEVTIRPGRDWVVKLKPIGILISALHGGLVPSDATR